MACGGCKLCLSYAVTPKLMTSFYCSKSCQAAAWLDHKSFCKASSTRRSLYRAADTIQSTFLIYREIVFEKLFSKIEESNGLLLLTESQYAHDDVFVPCPEALVKTKLDRQVILTHLTCNDALGWVHEFIKDMLEGLFNRIIEVLRILSLTNFSRLLRTTGRILCQGEKLPTFDMRRQFARTGYH